MAQHETFFADSILHGSCILDWIAARHFASFVKAISTTPILWVFLVNRIVTIAVPARPQWLPISNHCQGSPISLGNLGWHWSKKPLGRFWRHFFGTAEFKIWVVKKCFLWAIRQNLVSFAFLGAVGCRVLRQFCGTSFFVSKSPCFGRKKLKNADLGRKPYVNISGFLRQFCGRFSKVKIHLQMVKHACFTHPRSCRLFPPLTATNLLAGFFPP